MIKRFTEVQGAVFQKSPLAAGGNVFLLISILLFHLHLNSNPPIPSARAEQLKKLLSVSIDNCLKNKIYRNVDIGIQVSAIDGQQTFYRRNENKAYIPASAIKVFISAISLIKFGPGYQFETPIMSDGSLSNGILKDNLYLQGRGDPSLLYRHLEAAAKQLKLLGINIIEGNVVYDTAFLEEVPPRYPPNARHFYSPPGALTVNYNWIELELQEGPPPKLKTIPPTAYARLDYKIRISRSQNPGRPTMTYQEMPWGDQYTIRGTVTEWDKKYKYLCLCVSRPGLFSATLLREACEKAGINVKGEICKGKTPENAHLLYAIKTPPLKEVVTNLNRESNNVVAELLNEDLGAYFDSVPGTQKKGLDMIRNFIVNKLKFPGNSFGFADACGLSLENFISADQFTQALNYFYREIGMMFVETLARQGIDAHAMNPVPPEGMRIFCKSGTLSGSGVNTLVGYIFIDRTGEAFSFAILCNRRGKGSGALTYSGTYTNALLSAILRAIEQKPAHEFSRINTNLKNIYPQISQINTDFLINQNWTGHHDTMTPKETAHQ